MSSKEGNRKEKTPSKRGGKKQGKGKDNKDTGIGDAGDSGDENATKEELHRAGGTGTCGSRHAPRRPLHPPWTGPVARADAGHGARSRSLSAIAASLLRGLRDISLAAL